VKIGTRVYDQLTVDSILEILENELGALKGK